MTQKEYQEEIEKYKNRIRQLDELVTQTSFNQGEYERVLKDYRVISDLLEKERQANIHNTWVIEEQRKLIEKYETMINRITLGVGEWNNVMDKWFK